VELALSASKFCSATVGGGVGSAEARDTTVGGGVGSPEDNVFFVISAMELASSVSKVRGASVVGDVGSADDNGFCEISALVMGGGAGSANDNDFGRISTVDVTLSSSKACDATVERGVGSAEDNGF